MWLPRRRSGRIASAAAEVSSANATPSSTFFSSEFAPGPLSPVCPGPGTNGDVLAGVDTGGVDVDGGAVEVNGGVDVDGGGAVVVEGGGVDVVGGGVDVVGGGAVDVVGGGGVVVEGSPHR